MVFALPRRRRNKSKKKKKKKPQARDELDPRVLEIANSLLPSTQRSKAKSGKSPRKSPRRTLIKKKISSETYNSKKRNQMIREENKRLHARMVERLKISSATKRKEQSRRLKLLGECKKRIANPYYTHDIPGWLQPRGGKTHAKSIKWRGRQPRPKSATSPRRTVRTRKNANQRQLFLLLQKYAVVNIQRWWRKRRKSRRDEDKEASSIDSPNPNTSLPNMTPERARGMLEDICRAQKEMQEQVDMLTSGAGAVGGWMR